MVYIPFYRFWFILKYFVRLLLGELGIQTCTSCVHHGLDDHAGRFFHSFFAITARHQWCTSLSTVFGSFWNTLFEWCWVHLGSRRAPRLCTMFWTIMPVVFSTLFYSFFTITARDQWCTSLSTVFGSFWNTLFDWCWWTWYPHVHLVCAPWFGWSCRSFFLLFSTLFSQ